MKHYAKTFLTFAAAGLLMAPAAFAHDGAELEAALQQLASAEGAAYEQGRDTLLEHPELSEHLDGRTAAWTEATWKRDTIAAALQLRLANPLLIQKLNDLPGMNPQHYMARRKAGPAVLRELKWLKAEAAPAMAELLLKTLERYPHVDFPPGTDMNADTRAEWRAKEKLALAEGLCIVLGWTKHPSAPFVLKGILGDTGRAGMVRFAAAAGLGETMQPAVFEALETVLLNDEESVALRGACLNGIAKLPSQEALDALIAFTHAEKPDGLRRPAVAGLGTFGSVWGWQSRGQVEQGEAFRKQIVPVLVDVLATQGEQKPMRVFATQALSSIQHQSALPLLAALAADEERPAAVRDAASKAKQVLEIGLRRRAR